MGQYNEETIFLHCTAIPSWSDVEEFVVELFYKDLILPDMEKKKETIVRIEDRSHGGPHMDQEFKDSPEKEFDDWSLYSAWEELEENWRKYTRRYFDNYANS